MRENSIIKENILQYLDFKQVTKYEFYQKTGVSNGILSQKNGMSEDSILKFLSYYEDVNPEWLLTGKGDMLKKYVPISENDSEWFFAGKGDMLKGVVPVDTPVIEESPDNDNVRKLQDKLIKMQEDKIAQLEQEVRNLKKELESERTYYNVAEPSPELLKKLRDK